MQHAFEEALGGGRFRKALEHLLTGHIKKLQK